MASARDPRFHRPYTECIYQPMFELLAYEQWFQDLYRVRRRSEFMRPWTEKAYGIPPEQVIGSTIKTEYEMREGVPILMRLPTIDFIDDQQGKPVAIQRVIGRRPIFAFGNSDGDLQMLQWTAAGEGGRFMGLVHHDDAEREYAYDRDTQVGRFDTALDQANANGWTIVSMKNDWKTIFHPSP